MDTEYVSQLRTERLEVLKEHTRLTRAGYGALASIAWKSVERLTKEIKRAERKSAWWD